MKKSLFVNKALCCGCEACVNVCPSSVISMSADEEGFFYPVISNFDKCIDCHRCESVCPVKNIKKTDSFREKTYAGYSLCDTELKTSASGGLATALSKAFLAAGGIVYGVRYSADFEEAFYQRVENEIDLELLKSSKYAQARKYHVYKDILSDLKQKQKVLFIGLPCDAYALELFCGIYKENLYFCTLVCHGVTSPEVHREYISGIMKPGVKIKHFSLRYKYKGWKPYYIRAVFEDGSELLEQFDKSIYGNAFLYLKRPSCNKCQIKREAIHSDITIGDYHYAADGKHKPYNENGVSCAFVHSDKGQQLIDSLDGFFIEEVETANALHNQGYISAIPARKNRGEYGRTFAKQGLRKAAELKSCKVIDRRIKLKGSMMRRLSRIKRFLTNLLNTGNPG